MHSLRSDSIPFRHGSALSGQYSHLIYQESEDVNLALQFVGVPNERIEKPRSLVRGELAIRALVDYSDTIIEARETGNVDLFRRLAHRESLDGSSALFKAQLDQIEDGGPVYGNNG